MNKVKDLIQFMFSSNSEFIWQEEQLSKRIKKTILFGDLLDLFVLTMNVILYVVLFSIFKEILISIIDGKEILLNEYGVEGTMKIILLICNVIIPGTLFTIIIIKLVFYIVQKHAFGIDYIRMILNYIFRTYIVGPTLISVFIIAFESMISTRYNITYFILIICTINFVLSKISKRIYYLAQFARGNIHITECFTEKPIDTIADEKDDVLRLPQLPYGSYIIKKTAKGIIIWKVNS